MLSPTPKTPLTSELNTLDTLLILQSEQELRGRVLRGHVGLLSVEDLCDMFKVTHPIVSRWRKSNKGPRYIEMGNYNFYRVEDISAWLETRARTP